MPRKIVGYNGLADFFAYRQMQNQGTVKLYFGKGFTPEEEDREVKRALHFYEIANGFGHPRIHTLKIIHDDDEGRKPYYVHVDNVEWE